MFEAMKDMIALAYELKYNLTSSGKCKLDKYKWYLQISGKNNPMDISPLEIQEKFKEVGFDSTNDNCVQITLFLSQDDADELYFGKDTHDIITQMIIKSELKVLILNQGFRWEKNLYVDLEWNEYGLYIWIYLFTNQFKDYLHWMQSARYEITQLNHISFCFLRNLYEREALSVGHYENRNGESNFIEKSIYFNDVNFDIVLYDPAGTKIENNKLGPEVKKAEKLCEDISSYERSRKFYIIGDISYTRVGLMSSDGKILVSAIQDLGYRLQSMIEDICKVYFSTGDIDYSVQLYTRTEDYRVVITIGNKRGIGTKCY